MEVYDRYNLKKVDLKQDEAIIPGQYMIKFDGKVTRMWANNIDLNVNEKQHLYLCPGKEDSVNYEIGGDKIRLNYKKKGFPEDYVIKMISSIAEDIKNIQKVSELEKLPPLAKNVKENIEMTKFEKDLEKNLFHIEHIFHTPETHLARKYIKMPISLARRVSSKAINKLASHSEDWTCRTITSVIPKRIEGTIFDENFSIYENIIAIIFRKHTIKELEDRIRAQKETYDFNTTVTKDLDKSLGRDNLYTVKQRIARIFGELFKHILKKRDRPEEVRKKLEKLQTRLIKLNNSALYNNVNKRIQDTPVVDFLKETNLLKKHKDYKHLPRLWQSLKSLLPATDDKYFDIFSNAIDSYNRYVMLLVFYGIKNLEYTITETDKLSKYENGMVKFKNKLESEIEFTYDNVCGEYRITIKTKNQCEEIKFIAVPYRIEEKDIFKPKMIKGVSVYYLYYHNPFDSRSEEKIPKELNTIALKKGGVGYIPCGPMDIWSIERVARAIRWSYIESIVSQYPERLEIPRIGKTDEIIEELKKYEFLKIEKKQQMHYVKFISPANAIFDPDQNALFKQLLGTLKSSKQTKQYVPKIEEFRQKIFDCYSSTEIFSYICRCYICNDKNIKAFILRDQDTFEYQCESCNNSWGIKRCVSCPERFPYIKTNDLEDDKQLDEKYGMDLFARPIIDKTSIKYICPHCGNSNN